MKKKKWAFWGKNKKATKEFVRDERGALTTEMVVLIALVAIIAVGLIVVMGPALQNLFSNVLGNVTDMVNGAMA